MPDTTGRGYITIRLPYEDWVAIQNGIQEWANRDRDDIEILGDVTVLQNHQPSPDSEPRG